MCGKNKRDCTDSPTGQVLLGIRQFNAQEWFECQETFEELWLSAEGDLRNLYQGIIQLAIALKHWREGNFNGAVRLLEGAAAYLTGVPQPCLWIDLDSLRKGIANLKSELKELGVNNMKLLDISLIPKIVTVNI
jgi:predicted metal-dependent hydrolase